MAFIVRKPLIEDFDQINLIGRWFQENSLYTTCGWSDEKSLRLVVEGTYPDSNTFMRVVESEGQIVGFFLGHITEYFFSTKQIAQDLVMVFLPQKRAGIIKPTIKMLKEFEAWAVNKGAHEICIGITSGIAGPGYEQLIKRIGYREVGSVMKKEV